MTIQWYPGHMAKAKRMLTQELKTVDAVLELVDARIPQSSRNPDLQSIVTKSKIIIMTKEDLADESATQEWKDHFVSHGDMVMSVDLLHGGKHNSIGRTVRSLLPNLKRPPRVMVAGIPNVGKSTLINRLTKRRSAKVGAKPGVTRGKQWLSAEGMQLLDSPGILWPKFEDQEVAIKLAIVAAIRDEIFDQTEIALWLIRYLRETYPAQLEERYGDLSSQNPLEEIGRKRGCLLQGGVVDHEQAASIILKDFRTGKLGRITLDGRPADNG